MNLFDLYILKKVVEAVEPKEPVEPSFAIAAMIAAPFIVAGFVILYFWLT